MISMTKTVLITNGRFPATLDLIRNFAKNGVKVVVAETTLFNYCSTSNANSKNVHIPSPRINEEAFINRLVEIMETENIDLFIPGWEDVITVSKHLNRFKKGTVFTSEFSLISALHNKWEFSKLITRLGYKTPATFLINSKQDIENLPFSSFYLKTCYSRASMGTYFIKNKNNLPKLNFQKEQVIAQEPVDGYQFCTYSICHNGKITAHTTYPFHYLRFDKTKSRAKLCLSFEETHHPKIYQFVEEFAEKTNYTGSLAFDIFEEPDGSLTILECNPRLTSGTTLLTLTPNLTDAYFNTTKSVICPPEDAFVQYFLPSLLLMSFASIKNGSFKPFLKSLFAAKEIIFKSDDIKPYLFQPIMAIYYLYLRIKYRTCLYGAYSYDLNYEESNKAS